MNKIYDRSTLNSVPKALYNEYYKYFKKTNENEIKNSIAIYSQSGTKVSRKDVVETVWGSEAKYEEYLKSTAEDTVLQTLVCYAVVDELGIEFTDEMYKENLKLFAEEYNESNLTDYSESKIESICNKNILRLIFMEEKASDVLMAKIDGLPVLE